MALTALVIAGGCAPRVDNRGNNVDLDLVNQIEPGKVTRDQVLAKLGSPSNVTRLGTENWYYISENTETTAFLAPELTKRQIVQIRFNEHGVVEDVALLDQGASEPVEPVDRKTPTAGNTLGMIEQMLSNIGRFNKK
ncbi:MAG: outer membrane protein assembly factor BamE [Alphaproteobacteria bacterium]|nr:outer membrane protein assembly factor BamE [Alphaproteobacteria bacterium]MBF0249058.1 outer membrane protein assembly factor BamE [Alphaproteobacteria bacterium]